MSKNNVAVIGLAPMGKNLAKNIANHDYKVAVYNRTYEKTQDLLNENNLNIHGYKHLDSLVTSLELPRKIIIMVKSGQPIDNFIQEIYPMLTEGDILIDCGNSNYKDTERRQKQLEQGSFYTLEQIMSENKPLNKKIHFVGCGVSGGWLGALNGPSIMPGGEEGAVNEMLPILNSISARDFKGDSCVTNVGLGGAGHFVKTVHNGIEYAIMQGITEIYDILKQYYSTNDSLVEVFKKINTGDLESYLLDVTIEALEKKDESGLLLPRVDYKAGAKGTGSWTVESALELGVAIPNITSSVMMRIMSNQNQFFNVDLDQKYSEENLNIVEKKQIPDIKHFYNALEAIYLTSYLQGLDLIFKANQEYNWNINLKEVLRIWQGGCIIRSKMLLTLENNLSSEESINLTKEIKKSKQSLIEFFDNVLVKHGGVINILAVYNSSLDYCNCLLASDLPTNLIQLQRHIFGDHEIVVN